MNSRCKRAIIIFSITGCLITCKQKEGCEYFESIDLYFNQVFNVTLNEFEGNRIFYFLPLESCENCVFSNLEMLKKLKTSNLTLILIGTNVHPEWDILLSDLKRKYSFYEDPEKKIYSYQTNLGKPLVLSIEDGNCAYSKTVNDQDLENISIELSNL